MSNKGSENESVDRSVSPGRSNGTCENGQMSRMTDSPLHRTAVKSHLGFKESMQAQLESALHALAVELPIMGEMLMQLGGDRGLVTGPLSSDTLMDVTRQIVSSAATLDADVTILSTTLTEGTTCADASIAAGPSHSQPIPPPPLPAQQYAAPFDAASGHVSHLLVRLRSDKQRPQEIRIAVIGNVDSGKSTMVGVLTRSMLDDGRGAARSKVFKHDHEGATGRTSAIGQHNLCLHSAGGILNDAKFKNSTCSDYVKRASKVVTFVDLAGHERYFKTTAYGLTGHLPDYACLLVGANAGVVGMCKEHLGVALALKVPVFFVVTKVDICPEHILKQSLQQLSAVLKRPGVRKRPFLINSVTHVAPSFTDFYVQDVITCAKAITSEALAPIFLTSSVTGQGLELLRLFINLAPQRHQWAARLEEPVEFIIDETFGVPGVGTVVAGTVKRGVLSVNSPVLLGPDVRDGSFWKAAIKSIHYKRLPVSEAVAGQTAALALKKDVAEETGADNRPQRIFLFVRTVPGMEVLTLQCAQVKRDRVRKGMVMVHESLSPAASWEFDAEIAVLTHSTTIQPRYQSVIHCEIVRQAARVVAMDKERLRSGERATVRFRFLQRPEYITENTRFVFREGKTKGIGLVIGTEAQEKKDAAAGAAGSHHTH